MRSKRIDNDLSEPYKERGRVINDIATGLIDEFLPPSLSDLFRQRDSLSQSAQNITNDEERKELSKKIDELTKQLLSECNKAHSNFESRLKREISKNK